MERLVLVIYLGISILSGWYFESGDACFLPTIVLGAYILFCAITNLLIGKLTEKRINLPKSKKFNGRKSPIYKLVKYQFDIFFSIEKYELDYFELEEGYFLFLPFSAIFRTYEYRNTKTVLTSYIEENLKFIGNLSASFEDIHTREKAKIDLELVEKVQKQSIKEQLNQEFKENYI